MAPTMQMTGGCRSIFSHFEEFAASLPGASLVVTPADPNLFSAEISLLRLEELVLTAGRSTPLLFAGGLNTGLARIVLPLDRADTLRLNGLSVQPGDVAILGPGADYDGAWQSDASWAALALPAKALETLLKVPSHVLAGGADAHVVLRTGSGSWAETVSVIAAAVQVALEDPEVLSVSEAWRGLKADLLEAMRELLAAASPSDAAEAQATVPGRRHIIQAVEEILRTDPVESRSAQALGAAIGMTPSRLRAAIETSFGVEPEQYFVLRRLAMAHTARSTTTGSQASLSS